jgi:hypothetical protein
LETCEQRAVFTATEVKYEKLYDGCNWTRVMELLITKTLPSTRPSTKNNEYSFLKFKLWLIFVWQIEQCFSCLEVQSVKLKPQLLFLLRYTVPEGEHFKLQACIVNPSWNAVSEGDNELLFLLKMTFQRET